MGGPLKKQALLQYLSKLFVLNVTFRLAGVVSFCVPLPYCIHSTLPSVLQTLAAAWAVDCHY